MGIIIGADIVPTKSNQVLFNNGETTKLLGEELFYILKNADYRILNLEVPLTDKETPIHKCGPNLQASPKSINAIKNMGINLLTLANNHIMDQDTQGLETTLKTLDIAHIAHVGAGSDIYTAQKPYYFTINDIKYGVYACAEHEFSIAGKSQPGANPFDPLESLDHVLNMKANCDYAIVLYHGGKEHYMYPSPYLQKVCRKLVEKGADLVICQHSHCIGCMEEYMHGTIIYGQGNFLFDGKNDQIWNTGMLVELDSNGKITYIPLRKKNNCIQVAEKEDAEMIMRAFNRRSEEIKQAGFIEEQYSLFAQKKIDEYILCFSGLENSFFFRAINWLTGHRLQKALSIRHRRKAGIDMKNYIECEAHRELILHGLE